MENTEMGNHVSNNLIPFGEEEKKEVGGEGPIRSLPKDLIKYIFSVLLLLDEEPLDEEQWSFRSVCKEWKQIFESLPLSRIKSFEIFRAAPSLRAIPFTTYLGNEINLRRFNFLGNPFWMEDFINNTGKKEYEKDFQYIFNTIWFAPFRLQALISVADGIAAMISEICSDPSALGTVELS